MSHTAEHSHAEVHVHRDDFGSKLGMWLFLFTEVILFGGLFLLYFSYRVKYSHDFHEGAMELDLVKGTMNTAILLTSSLTMALSILFLTKGNKKWSLIHLAVTILCGFGFLINKYFEYGHKIELGIYPSKTSGELMNMPEGQQIFFGLYWAMTGLHSFHVIVGMILLSYFGVQIIKQTKVTQDNYARLENGGLYWHLVDLIWIFLFPLFYLLH